MIEGKETHDKIVSVLNENGPSLPIKISKDLGISSLFISAFLSELSNEKRIKVSSLKVGGSPLYYLEGQEDRLEDYHKYLHPREVEAFLLLRKHKVLKDSDLDPAMRVALRSIRDFAVGFKKDDEIYWRYVLVDEGEIRGMFDKGSGSKTVKKEGKVFVKRDLGKKSFDNPLVKEEKKKEKPRGDFVSKVIDFIKDNGLKIVEERDYKAKEYNCVVSIKSELGNINFLTQAKDKKTINESDFSKLLSNAQKIPLPAFMLYTGEISKKAKEYLKDYSSILKAKKIL